MTGPVRKWLPLVGALVVALITVGAPAWQRPPALHQETAYVLDTYVKFQVAGRGAAEAVAAATKVMGETERALNRYDDDSDIARVNQAAGEWAAVGPLTTRALSLARLWEKRSDGAFDVSLGKVLDLYKFGGTGHVPDDAEVQATLAGTGPRAWEADTGTARVLSAGVTLDLGGLHKGLAVDLAGEELTRRGMEHALVDAGGNMLALGPRPDGKPWRIGIQHPRRPGEVIAVVPLSGRAISTSGDYQQFFEQGGVRYHHILDPNTGRPARGTVAVTVLAPTAAEADILSTALFVLGPEAGLRMLSAHPDVDALFVTDDLSVILSPGLRGIVEVR